MEQQLINKIIKFTDLNAWKEGHKLVIQIYAITKKFPNDELFGLTSQMRRAAVTITSNIAEGFGRYSYKEKVQFYYISAASALELQDQLTISLDLGYVSQKQFTEVSQQAIDVHKIITGLIKGARKTFIHNS